RVEMASEFAVSEVFSHKKPHSGISSLAVPLQSSEQLRDHDDAYSISLFLQGLMEQDVLDSGMIEELALDAQQMRKKLRNPIITMEARHQQVRENRARREAERLRQQREREAQRGSREEAKRRERDMEMRKRQEERRQEEMVQQEMVRLRRQMEERRGLEQLVRQRYGVHSNRWLVLEWMQQSPILKIGVIWPTSSSLSGLNGLICLQRHFSGWYSVVLDRRLRMGKALALCDWKRQLRAWRAWRAVVWDKQKQGEVARTEEALRTENRQCQLAVESDRRRLLRRCLSEWQLWCRMEKEQRELLARQQETKRKMAALISAASTGKLKATETPTYQLYMAPPEAPSQPETTEKVRGALTTPYIISNSKHQFFGTHNSQAEMKAAEEQRQREEEEEKRKAAEKRREEKRLEKEREEERQRQLKRQKELLKVARQHYNRTLLLRRGLAPWKRLIQFRQLAERHHNLFLLRRCVRGWQQSARESLSEKEASADQLHQHFLLRRSLSRWKRVFCYCSLAPFPICLSICLHFRRVLQRCFLAWRQLPCLLRRERERDERREKLGRKVTEVLPDFCSHPL
uniref:Coiled-coil domain containing 191 n=1 Tax=Stegastes partitus TaxID=144197 RepID=A0A3B5AHZ8_9TELE